MDNIVSKYKYPNYHVPPGLVNDLLEYYKYLRLGSMARMMESMGCHMIHAWMPGGASVKAEDLECMYGDTEMAYDVELMFYGGPEKLYDTSLAGAMDHMFEVVNATALEWFVDTVLMQIQIHGFDVLRTIQYAGLTRLS